jgi:DhnA family fructose-bisphosphate aldolase class Ia
VAGAARAAAELGAHVVKTSIPTPPAGIAAAAGCGLPILLAGGEPAPDPEAYLAGIGEALAAGASGVAVGRNVWGRPDPAGHA